MGMFSNYDRVGPGVSKNPDDKLPIFKFFEIYFSHFSKLIILNLYFIVSLLPILLIMFVENLIQPETPLYYVVFYTAFILLGSLIGPASCGFMKILRNISCRRPVFMWHDYIGAVKSNFKQGILIGLIDMVFIVLMSMALPMYYNMSAQNSIFYIPFIICLVSAVLFLMMHSYIYLLMVSTNLGLWKILKNSFFLMAIDIKTSVINLVITVVVTALAVIFFPYSAFLLVVIPSFLGLIYAFNCFPNIRKYVIKPWYDARGEEAPEVGAITDIDSETLFKDTPETEVPREIQKPGRNKKIK